MANTLKFGNGNWATKEDSVLAYNDENNNFKPLPFDFTRASTATYVDSDGLIKTARNGEARVDYTDSTDGALLLEPARTNLVNYSKDFSSWTQADTSTVSIADSFDGSNNAYRVSITSASSFQTIRKTGLSVSNTQTFTIYAKKDTLNFIRILFGGFGNFWVDLENGTQGTTTGSFDDITITSVGNGFFKIVATFTPTSAVTHVYLYPSVGDGNANQTSGSVIFQYAQLEVGSYATSYIPTSGSTVTRVAESCSQTPTTGIIGQTEGVLYVDFIFKGVPNGTSSMPISLDGTGSNEAYIYINNTNIRGQFVVAGSFTCNINGGTLVVGNRYKVAFSYKANDFALCINGVLVGIDDNGAVGSNQNVVLGNYLNQGYPHDNITESKLYNTRLTNAELATLTTI